MNLPSDISWAFGAIRRFWTVSVDDAGSLGDLTQSVIENFEAIGAWAMGWLQPLVAHPFATLVGTLLVGVLLFGISAVLGEQNTLEDESDESDPFAATGASSPAAEPDDDGSTSVETDETGSQPRDTSQPVDDYYELFDRAEQLRRAGRGIPATKLYERGIRASQKAGESADYGLPVDPFRDYARMLYHMGADEHAIEILDTYIEFERRHQREPDGPVVGLRRQLERGELRRLDEKYHVVPDDTDPSELPDFIRQQILD